MKTHIGYNGPSLGILAFAVLLVLLVPGQAAAVDFGQDVTVTSNSHRQEYPSAAVGPNGDIFVVWQDDQNNPGITSDIFCARSTDNGSTFTVLGKIDDSSGNPDHIYPQITADSQGKLHAVWADYRSGSYYQIYYANSTDNGSTWSANVQVNYTVTGTQTQPSVATDSSNNIYVAWDDGRSGSHVYVAKSTDGGASFGAAKKVDSSTGSARHCWVCVAPNDNVSVAWEDSRNSNWDIFLATSTDGGSSFGSEVNVTTNTSGSSQTYPRVAADPGSGLDVVWSDNRDGNYGVFCGASSDGSTFSAVAVNDTDTGITASQAASLAVDSAGVVHVAWQDKRSGSGHFRTYYSESDGSGGFITSVRVDNTTTADCYHPFVTVDPNDVPSLVWDDNRNSNEDIFYDTPQNVPPLAPDLVYPAADTWVNTGTPAFNWTFRDVNGSDTQSAFQLLVAAASDFALTA